VRIKREDAMRKVTTSVVGVFLAGLVLLFVTRNEIAAAAGGFTVADFKGRYVGHYVGSFRNIADVDVQSGGIISIDADGSGSATIFVKDLSDLEANPSGSCSVDASGLLSCSGLGLDFQGILSDRGKTLDFEFHIRAGTLGVFRGAGATSIQ
jgi:hypothetical protein